MTPKTILVLGGYDRSLLNFRGSLLRAMVRAGCKVIGAAPAETSDVARRLAEMGVRFVPVALARAGLNPFVDVVSLRRLKELFKRERPDIVLSYTIKPVIYGSLAAGWTGVPRVYALITGLGAAFYTTGAKGKILRFGVKTMYRLALTRCTKVFVQNKEIASLFVREGIVPHSKVVVVPGSGVDTEHFAFSPPPESPPVFLYLGRLLRDKGIAELVTAARLVKAVRPDARFILMGETDPNPASFSRAEVDSWQQEGVVELQGFQNDVRPMLAQCSIYVLPSYHEGLPRSVLEAMAMGKPVITTDTIGCREMVFDASPRDASGVQWGINGALVPVRDARSLAAAMLELADDPARVARMGCQGRLLAERHFDVNRVNAQMLSEMKITEENPKPSLQPIKLVD